MNIINTSINIDRHLWLSLRRAVEAGRIPDQSSGIRHGIMLLLDRLKADPGLRFDKFGIVEDRYVDPK